LLLKEEKRLGYNLDGSVSCPVIAPHEKEEVLEKKKIEN